MSKKNADPQYTSDTLERQVEENSTSIQLLKQSIDYMKEGLDDIKVSITSLRAELKNGFVTKEQFERLKADVVELKNVYNLVMKTLIIAVVAAVLTTIGLNSR